MSYLRPEFLLRYSQWQFPRNLIFKTFLVSGYFLTELSSTDTNSGVHQNTCRSPSRFNYSSVSCFVLALASADTNLPYITLIFHEFPGLENEILKFYDYPGFSWPVRTDWVEKSERYNYQKYPPWLVSLTTCWACSFPAGFVTVCLTGSINCW